MSSSLFQRRSIATATYVLASLFSVLLFLKNAWVAEDAFIILRSVDQFLLGHGFRWNPHERVQVFTSPLWYLLIIASTAFCKTLYLNLVGLSLLLHVALLAVMARLMDDVKRWLAAVLLLTLSQAFFDFTASGLEYPLVYLLLAAFVLLYLRDRHTQDRHWLALCAGLALVTRHDLLFILSPMLLHLAWVYQRQLGKGQLWTTAALFIAPLAGWTLFSLIYYGFPFPNTAYAKLGIDGVTRAERLLRGLTYLSVSLKLDPITPITMLLAIVQCIRCRQRHFVIAGCGILLAFAYITWIGADYMVGRFYAPVYLVAILVLARFPWQWPVLHRPLAAAIGIATAYLVFYMIDSHVETIASLLMTAGLPLPDPSHLMTGILALGVALTLACLFSQIGRTVVASLFAVLLATSTQQHDSPWQTGYRDWGKRTDFDLWWNLQNVSRERYFIYHWTSLYAWTHRDRSRPFPDHPWCHEGIALPDVAVTGFAGMTPYCMGTGKISIDVKALTDPLLPRMPKYPGAIWSSGGVNRLVPDGYVESVQAGTNRIRDPDLARYYDKLQVLTQAEPLFSVTRLKTVIAFNAGVYDSWLDSYRSRLAQQPSPVVP